MESDTHKRNVKIAIISAVVAFIILVIIAIALFIRDTKRTATLNIVIAPSMAKVEIDGKTYKTSGVFRLDPGHYSVKVSADDFIPQETEIDLIGGETTDLMLYLMPSDGTLDWYINHPDEMMILDTIGDAEAYQTATNYHNDYPISKALPIVVVEVDKKTYAWTEYRIDGGTFEECENKDFCVKITDTTGGNKEAALAKIRAAGYNPDDYEVIYEYVPIEPLE